MTALLLVVACGENRMACDEERIRHEDRADARRGPRLECDPTVVDEDERCDCMAAIMCDQIRYCLAPEELVARGEAWSSYTLCRSALADTCRGGGSIPEDYPSCLRDLEAATCSDLGQLTCAARDLPASCGGLGAVEEALGIPAAC